MLRLCMRSIMLRFMYIKHNFSLTYVFGNYYRKIFVSDSKIPYSMFASALTVIKYGLKQNYILPDYSIKYRPPAEFRISKYAKAKVQYNEELTY